MRIAVSGVGEEKLAGIETVNMEMKNYQVQKVFIKIPVFINEQQNETYMCVIFITMCINLPYKNQMVE